MKTTCTREQALRFLALQVGEKDADMGVAWTYWTDVLGRDVPPKAKAASEILTNAGSKIPDEVLKAGRKVESGLVLMTDWMRAVADKLDPRLLAGGKEGE